jgi:DNA repair exonuclease SbcCD ATPase subunit
MEGKSLERVSGFNISLRICLQLLSIHIVNKLLPASSHRVMSRSPSSLAHASPKASKSSHVLVIDDELKEEVQQAYNVEMQHARVKIHQLETELRLATELMSSREGIHAEELRKVEQDNAKTILERRAAQHKLQSVHTVEDAVRDLYLSMKDRIGYGGNPTPESVRSEKEELKDMSILVVLGHLHSICKGLYLFKQEAEEDMRGTKARVMSRDENTLLGLKKQINDLKAKLREAKIETESAVARAEAADAARVRTLEESQIQVKKMAEQHQDLLEELRKECDLSSRLKEALDEACEEGRRRDTLVMTNRQLESKRYFDRASQDKTLRTLQAQHERAMKMKDVEIRTVSDLRMQIAKLEAEVSNLKADKTRLQMIKKEVKSPISSPLRALESSMSRASSFGGDQSVKSFVSRPASAVSAAGSQRRFTAEGSIVKSSEALMQKLRDGFAKEEKSAEKVEKEAGFDELAREYSITDVTQHHKASKQAIKAMRSTLNVDTVEGIADLDLSGSPLATSVLFSAKTNMKKSSLVGEGGKIKKGAASHWGVQGATGLEPRSVSFKNSGASEQLQAIKNKIDAGIR